MCDTGRTLALLNAHLHERHSMHLSRPVSVGEPDYMLAAFA